jgi:CubicO group peptidase (beta-lactamase class C family)
MKNSVLFSTLLLLNVAVAFAVKEPLNATATASTPPSTYAEPSKQMLQDFEQYVQKSIKEWNIPGMAIGIVQGDKVLFAKGFGVKTVGGSDPVDPQTIFQIGSITKSFTAALTAMLVDEGKFKWDDKVVEHLPEFMLYDPWVTREFEVSELMSQHSGLPPHAGDALYMLVPHPIYNDK